MPPLKDRWGFLRRPNGAAAAFMIAGSSWFVLGAIYGFGTALHLIDPEIYNNVPFLTFGRIRPGHVNTMAYGFVATTLIGAALYYVPAILKRRLYSEPLAWLGFALWNLCILAGAVTLPLGITQGREYSEYVWVIDLGIIAALLVLLYDGIRTIWPAQGTILQVPIWYFIGALIWTVGDYPIGNVIWHPRTGALSGIMDSLLLWFYGHNLVGLLLTPLAVGAAYYVVSRVARAPVYSYTLSLVGFWTLVLFYTHIGGHHIMQAPIPDWVRSVSGIDSMMMFIPVVTAIVNLWLTARGRGGAILADPAARWVMFGIGWYLLVGAQGSFQSLSFVQWVTHFNNWTVGHAHIAVLGFAGFIALGAMWHVFPKAVGRRLWSRSLVNLQFGLVMFGLSGFFVVLTIAGLIQGEAWNNGEVVYRVLPEIAEMMIFRALLGVFIFAGAVVGLYNVLRTRRDGAPLTPAEAADEEDRP